MKVLFSLIILFGNTTFAQSAKLNGKIEYEMFLNFNKIQKYNSVLFFNDSISIFSYKNIDVNLEEHMNTDNPDKIKSNTVIIDTTSYNVIIKKKENLLYSKHKDSKNKTFYYAKENIPLIKWQLLNDKKKILTIECNLAKVHFRGRTYFAWYASSIPNTLGPWKLNGLPGLILEAYDDLREVIFKVKSINIPNSNNFELINPNYSIISIEEHIKKREKKISELESKIQSKMGRNIKIKVNTTVKGIELNYDDLQN